ncbi:MULTISPECIES: response regulator transcription factor [Vagococcus]|uniref:Phosphate regulon transcriptional regulatory protein PhoB (SphR) n=1 Tax=Vagococcus fluvialis bH819 TaxID=1255619 RepID=A0A1X6WS96_9ENTE|nr:MULTISPECIES: response regulator transcription factor [Vagococcus]SLM87231.1 Phosphate regulon transcriptional regulatory protein PhoB (SphR) [Vagococcus fluvialis bH819]HCM89103.1 DNA-binding response regulator [Vagococcus sp.]
MAKILIVEDELSINFLIETNLRLVGHKCDVAFDGIVASEKISKKNYDLVLLDIMLPGKDGFSLIKEVEDVPIIFLTARSELSDKVKGLQLGADDYIVKPFEMVELIARIDAILRRTKKRKEIIKINDFTINFLERTIVKEGAILEVTPQEFSLLEVLIVNRNISLSREKLLELAWGFDFEGDSRTVDVHIQRIRKKMNMENMIKTVYKMGYRLEVKDEI